MSQAERLPSSPTLHVLSLNCWGLKWLSKHRAARLSRIGEVIAATKPAPQLVCLQECWTQEDFLSIQRSCHAILPYSKFYFSGAFGGGLAIFSAWPITDSSMFKYPLNGQPSAFYRGDWFVGKGVASARIQLPADIYGSGKSGVLEVFNTHLHAPYKPEHLDTYVTHRTAQAWEIARLMRNASERGHLVIGCGDFNMRPKSLAHQLIEAHGQVDDVWRELYPDSSLGSSQDALEQQRLETLPHGKRGWSGDAVPAGYNIRVNGATCDSAYNTWRWNKGEQKRLDKGDDILIPEKTPDPRAKRLDYIFYNGRTRIDGRQWVVQDAKVTIMERHPQLKCSLSDHFGVAATLRLDNTEADIQAPKLLSSQTYADILRLVEKYTEGEVKQGTLRTSHFWLQLFVTIGCLVGVWWTPNYASFILMLVSSLGLSAGVVDGLIGFLFVRTELRGLWEFKWEIQNAERMALDVEGETPGGHATGATVVPINPIIADQLDTKPDEVV